MPHRPNDARHRGGQQPTSRPRRFFAGLALPTAAAIVLMFIAAGTAVATTRPAAVMQNVAAMTAQPAVVESAAARASRFKAIETAQTLALAQTVARDEAVVQAEIVANAKVVARAQAVARGKAAAQAKTAARAKAAANAQAAARVRLVARKLSVSRSNQRRSLAARAIVARRATSATRISSARSWIHPLSRRVSSSGFGYRWGRMHNGEDYAVSTGTPLRSMSAGTVSLAETQSGYGNIVQIRYWDGTISYYGHMATISVRKGQAVKQGEVVGLSGNSGRSTGPHLHLEIHPRGGAPVDPLPWLAAHNVGS